MERVGKGTVAGREEARRRRVYVAVLNWNGWTDTIECLESLARLSYPDVTIVVCDNGSTDGSVEMIADWAAGKLDVHVPADNPLRRLSFPPVPKPFPCELPDREDGRHGPAGDDAHRISPRLVILESGENLGFGGGTNVALRYILERQDASYVWLLNNDTIVEPGALDAMVAAVEAAPLAEMCGSTVLSYSEPEVVQAAGGFRYNPWLGTSARLLESRRAAELAGYRADRLARLMYGIYGASVLVSRRFLEDVGPMCEQYFLYFEEQDWAVRARRRGIGMTVARNSIVYHKEGRSTGASSRSKRSELSDYHSIRSRVLFTRRHYPYALPTVILGLVGVVARRVRRGQWNRMGLVVRAALSGAAAGAREAENGDARW